jgi:hypothetical protein
LIYIKFKGEIKRHTTQFPAQGTAQVINYKGFEGRGGTKSARSVMGESKITGFFRKAAIFQRGTVSQREKPRRGLAAGAALGEPFQAAVGGS